MDSHRDGTKDVFTKRDLLRLCLLNHIRQDDIATNIELSVILEVAVLMVFKEAQMWSEFLPVLSAE